MKTLKFDHNLAQLILAGKKNSTWRLFDDKNLTVNDDLVFIDKVQPAKPQTWREIGHARVTEIVEKRLEDVTEQDMLGGEVFATKKQMIKHYQRYYGKKANGAAAVKIIYFDFEEGRNTGSLGIDLKEARLYTDGGSRGNPGPSACAYVICNLDDTVVEKSGFFMGRSTNNRAEYQGLRLGLERAKELAIKNLEVFMDSQLVVNQVKGLYRVKNVDLAPIHQEVLALAKLFEKIDFTYVPREINRLSDAEVNRILDEQKSI